MELERGRARTHIPTVWVCVALGTLSHSVNATGGIVDQGEATGYLKVGTALLEVPAQAPGHRCHFSNGSRRLVFRLPIVFDWALVPWMEKWRLCGSSPGACCALLVSLPSFLVLMFPKAWLLFLPLLFFLFLILLSLPFQPSLNKHL